MGSTDVGIALDIGSGKMDEVGEAEEIELLGGVEDQNNDQGNVDSIDEDSAEVLMTDMKLDDDSEEIRNLEPDSPWMYHFEVYPWNADDMTENFVKLVKLASFTRVAMRKKRVTKESDLQERLDDKLLQRNRKGCVHLYCDTWHTARTIMRSLTWKSMSAKELTIEITRQDTVSGKNETACLEVDTYSRCKVRFRDKPTGEFKDRSAKVSNILGTISREFLDVVFSRANAVLGGSTEEPNRPRVKENELHQQLQEIEGFNGTIEYDCLHRGSCRAFVNSHKSVYICGQKISIVPNCKETMVVPPFTHDLGKKKTENNEYSNVGSPISISSEQTDGSTMNAHLRGGRGNKSFMYGRGMSMMRSMPNTHVGPPGRGATKDPAALARGRGLNRGMSATQRPVSAQFQRPGPGMPIPMTGRQKMNEKMRRSQFGMVFAGANGGPYTVPGNSAAQRNLTLGSVGDSFKQEIASLQNELQRSTLAIEAKIARLQQENDYYNEEMISYDDSEWCGDDFDYNGQSFDSEGYYGNYEPAQGNSFNLRHQQHQGHSFQESPAQGMTMNGSSPFHKKKMYSPGGRGANSGMFGPSTPGNQMTVPRMLNRGRGPRPRASSRGGRRPY